MTNSGAEHFANFIRGLREKRNLSMKQLCEGLCSDRAAWYIEQGKREPSRLLRQAILERLGVGADDYESYLGYVEYTQWRMQQNILHNITFNEIERAEKLLETYWNTYCIDEKQPGEERNYTEDEYSIEKGDIGAGYTGVSNKKLETQFYLSMLAQIRCYNGRKWEACSLFKEAISLTVPALEEKKITELALSIKELNLLLEAEHSRIEGERPERYREVLEYIESGKIDRRGMAKTYPKVVFFLCRYMMDEDTIYSAESGCLELWKYCNQAVKILRDNGRMYFLWELLDIKERLLDRLNEISCGRFGKGNAFQRHWQENTQWKQALEAVYEEFCVPKENP